MVRSQGLTPLSLSSVYSTPAFPAGSGPDFANAVIALEAGALAPAEVLSRLHRVEAALGRERRLRWGARTVDLDLIAMGEAVLPSDAVWQFWHDLPPERQQQEAPDELILPHPRLQDRAFVLVPMAEIAGGWRHPRNGLTVTEMLARLPEAEKRSVVPLAAPPEGWHL